MDVQSNRMMPVNSIGVYGQHWGYGDGVFQPRPQNYGLGQDGHGGYQVGGCADEAPAYGATARTLLHATAGQSEGAARVTRWGVPLHKMSQDGQQIYERLQQWSDAGDVGSWAWA